MAPPATITPTAEQEAILAAYLTREPLVIDALAGSGKALRYDQPILTPAGWREIGSLKTGDLVVGSAGQPVLVTGVYPQGVRDLFEVVISDGTTVTADADHLWLTTTTRARDQHQPPKVRTTAEIAATLRLKNGRINHYLPMLSAPVEMPHADLALDPYLLGVLLGDGGLGGGSVVLSTPDAEILAAVESMLPEGVRALRVEGTACDYRLSAGQMTMPGRRGLVNPLVDALRELGVWGSLSADKRIPDSYLFASADQRLSLLQGLLDTDGSAARIAVEFSSASKVLAEQVTWLAQSLGGYTHATERQPWHTYKGERRDGQTSYRLRISLPSTVVPFRLTRKREALKRRERFEPFRQIVDVRPVPSAEAVCISVDAVDKLYLTAGCVPTHNTSTLRMLSAATPRVGALYVAYNKAIAVEAEASFPSNTLCRTAHSLAYQAVGYNLAPKLRHQRQRAAQVASILGIRNRLIVTTSGDDSLPLSTTKLARLTLDTISRFSHSADYSLERWHVPQVKGLSAEGQEEVDEHVLAVARKAWADLCSSNGRLRLDHDHYLKCQPPGTMVTTTRRVGNRQEFVKSPIEQIRPGDKVATWCGPKLGKIRRTGRSVTHVGQRHYEGQIVTATTASGASSSYTHDHICVATIGDAMDGQIIVYLMRRGTDYRIGRVMWRYGSQGNVIGLLARIRMQEADAVWVLSSHATEKEAALAEALTQHEFGIPGWQFQSLNEAMPLAEFWAKAGGNHSQAAECLRAHGRDPLYPLWEKGDGQKLRTRVPLLIRACNLMDGMRVCEVDQVEPNSDGVQVTGGWTRAWQPIKVTRTPYSGPVHAIEVDEDHTYIADGIVTHNCWHLTHPVLSADVILMDEAQDANPVVTSIVQAQTHAQLVLVGDRHQQLYQWRGAHDAMTGFRGRRLALTKSFRFGPAIAEVANEWLTVLGSELRIVGHDPVLSTVGPMPYEQINTILCRTNAGCIAQAIAAEDRGLKACIVGGTGELAALARAAAELQERGETAHPEFMGFLSWGDVVEYAEGDAATENLATFVRLVNAYGPQELLRIIDTLTDSETAADLIVSTGHKAKGREWAHVRIGDDFKPAPRRDEHGELVEPEMNDEARMLAYVAVTRARLHLDPAGLAWARPTPAPASTPVLA